MSAREPKTTQFTTIQIVGRDSGRKGRLELSSGTFSYFPKNAPKPAISLTYQQLTDLLDDAIEYEGIDPNGRLPKGGDADFYFEGAEYAKASDVEDLPEYPLHSFAGSCPLSKMDSGRVDDGQYSLFSLNASSKPSKRTWYASISVPLAISIVAWYIDKFLAGKRATIKNTKAVILTKDQMRRVLLQLLKKLDD